MKKIIIVLLIIISSLIITGCSNDEVIKEISYEELEERINNKESFILELVQTGCSHCEEFSPRFQAILKTNNLNAYSLNLYNLTEDEIEKFDNLTTVTGTPTVLFFEDGKETSNRINGAVANDKIEEELKENGYIKEKE